jgi:hypothetical protein
MTVTLTSAQMGVINRLMSGATYQIESRPEGAVRVTTYSPEATAGTRISILTITPTGFCSAVA